MKSKEDEQGLIEEGWKEYLGKKKMKQKQLGSTYYTLVGIVATSSRLIV